MKKKVDYEWVKPYKVVTCEYCTPDTITYVYEPTVTTGSLTTPVIYSNWCNGMGGLASTITTGVSTATASNSYNTGIYQLGLGDIQSMYGQISNHYQYYQYANNALNSLCGAYGQPPETAEEKAARLKRAEEVEARRKAASLRAEHLLFTILTPSQVKQYTDDDFIELVVKGRTYRIRKGYSRNVELIEAGKPTVRYCAHPADAYKTPVPDAMLAQLLMIQHNEAEFLKVANRTVLQ